MNVWGVEGSVISELSLLFFIEKPAALPVVMTASGVVGWKSPVETKALLDEDKPYSQSV